MDRVLEGCREKIARAEKHLDVLDDEWQRFLHQKPHPYEFVIEVRVDALDKRRVSFFVVPDPPVVLSVLVGEAVHNLRSALDHLIWPIAVDGFKSVKGRPPNKREAKQIQFPIFSRIGDFRNAKVLSYLPKDALAAVKARQPYRRGKRSAHFHELAELARLSNEDKHRSIAATAVYPDPHDLSRLIKPRPGAKIIDKRVRVKAGRPLETGAVVADITFATPPEDAGVYMEGHVGYGIAFGELPADPRDPSMDEVVAYVRTTVDVFEPILKRLL